MEFLPDSRSREGRGCIRSPHGNLVPIYCANCGCEWGLVPEKFITFAFCLCDPCAEKHGDVAHTYQEPDAVFWERVNNAMKEEQIQSRRELELELEDSTTTLSKLATEWDRHVLSK